MTLKLLHIDHARHITLILSSARSVSLVLMHVDMQESMPIHRRRRKSTVGVQRLLYPMGVWGAAGEGEGAALGIVFNRDMGAGVPR